MDAKISQKINDWHPYEELLPDYDVDISTNSEIKLQNESIELIKKSKLEYIKSYIDNIDENVLKDKNIDKDKLILIDDLNDVIKKVKDESLGDIYTMVCFDMTANIHKLIEDDENEKV